MGNQALPTKCRGPEQRMDKDDFYDFLRLFIIAALAMGLWWFFWNKLL